jgi:hypothetical protein
MTDGTAERSQPLAIVGGSMETAELDRAILALTIAVESSVSAVVDDVVRRQRTEIPELAVPDEELAGALRDAAAVGLLLALSSIRLPSAAATSLPPATAHAARLAARRKISLGALVHAQRVAHAVYHESLLRHAERQQCGLAALQTVSRRLFDHIDGAIALCTREYREERRRHMLHPDRALYERVGKVLAGAEVKLDHPLEGTHVAVVLSAPSGPAAARQLALRIEGPVLVVSTPDGGAWVWIASDDLAPAEVQRLLAGMALDGVGGIGDRESGREGFQRGHRKAQVALQVGTRLGGGVFLYADTALEAVALCGEGVAREFAYAELGALAEDSERAAALRTTMRVYFDCGSSAAAAARALGIAERTVTYRLRRAEQMIGRQLAGRRAEIESALRLNTVLGPVG